MRYLRISQSNLLLMLAAAATLSSCSPARMQMFDGSSSSNGSQSTGGSGASITNRAALAKACADAQARGELKTQTFPVHFGRSAPGCEWGADGNLGMREGRMQARREQVEQVSLPPNTVLCDLEFRFANQPFYYDDEFFFSFNGAVMASSYNFGSLLTAASGIQDYDWSRLVGHAWTEGVAGPYCAGMELGLSTCSFPSTSSTGRINLNYDQGLILDVAARTLPQTQYEFRWITTGDNDDPVDCRHDPVDLEADFTYLEL